MKHTLFSILAGIIVTLCQVHSSIFQIQEKSIEEVFAGRNCSFVMREAFSTKDKSVKPAVYVYNQKLARKKLAPCSTFKIWNTLIGAELGIIASADEPFYKWDGQKRFIPEWNKDLTFKEAFQASCVPAFQYLARKIGPQRMQSWLDKIHYGDGNTSAGIDVFWLPEKGRKTILITPEEQAALICHMVRGELPFSAKAREILQEVMLVRKTEKGTLYGKTGSGRISDTEKIYLGWFVGYVESNGKTYAFACVSEGETLMGKDVRGMVEAILEKNGYL